METRSINQKPNTDNQHIQGRGIVFYDGTPETQYPLWEGAVERIASDVVVNKAPDVISLYNHDINWLLGRESAGTLTVTRNDKGFDNQVKPDNTDPQHQTVTAKINRGDLQGASFTFTLDKAEWQKEKDMSVRYLKEITLYEIGPVVTPAYSATTTSLRSQERIEALKKEHDEWEETQKRLEKLQNLTK